MNIAFYLFEIVLKVYSVIHKQHWHFVAVGTIGGLCVVLLAQCQAAASVECYAPACGVVCGALHFQYYVSVLLYQLLYAFAPEATVAHGGVGGEMLDVYVSVELPVA